MALCVENDVVGQGGDSVGHRAESHVLQDDQVCRRGRPVAIDVYRNLSVGGVGFAQHDVVIIDRLLESAAAPGAARQVQYGTDVELVARGGAEIFDRVVAVLE